MEIDFTKLTCVNCGTIFYMQENLYKVREKDHDQFFCPNGHALCVTDNSKKINLEEENKKLHATNLRLSKELEILQTKTAKDSEESESFLKKLFS